MISAHINQELEQTYLIYKEENWMLCKRCMTVMKSGTTYEQKKDGDRTFTRRFYKCNKCHDKVYTKEPNFQEYLNKAIPFI